MDPRHLFADQRLSGFCVYCGGPPDTVDHVPSKVLLDKPYPENLPVVDACLRCNNGFSNDELYVACLIECIICGTVDAAHIGREKIARLLSQRPNLARMIEGCCTVDPDGSNLWRPEEKCVRNVLLKLARGHAAFECTESHLEEPKFTSAKPLLLMSREERQEFEAPEDENPYPEIGSRAFLRTVVVGSTPFLDVGWQVVQEGRYRYLVSASESSVRVVLSEYLACKVAW